MKKDITRIARRSVLIALIFFLALTGSVYATDILLTRRIPGTVRNFAISLGVITLSVLFVRLTRSILRSDNGDELTRLTEHQLEITYRAIQISVYVFSFVLLLTVWKIDISSVLLGAGILSIVGGLAARQTLSSVLSGVIIMSTNMVRLNQWIEFKGKFGKVTKITFYNTHMVSPQGEKHVIPNEALTSHEVTNLSDGGRYRNDILVGIDYETDIERAINVIDSELSKLERDENHKAITGFQSTSVKSFDDSAIKLAVKFWIEAPTPAVINDTQTVVFRSIHQRFEKEGIKVPFQQTTVSFRE